MPTLSANLLDSYLGMHIGDVCLNQFDGNEFNHCAHFVGHALRISNGKTCYRMVHSSRRIMDPATILVNDLFDVTPDTHELLECPTTGQGLIFVSAPTSFEQIGSNIHRIRSVRKRHVGIYMGGTTWHYSNARRKVVSQTTSSFLDHYRGQTNALWIGDLPSMARPIPYGVSMS
ncbi:MAG: hypothetical protein R2748_10695 [Bryobacterales bacterium]